MADILSEHLWLDLIGRTYAHLGRGQGAKRAIDCYGLVIEIMRRQGVHLADVPYDDTDIARCERIEFDLRSKWAPCEIKPGAALVFGRQGLPTHCGIAIDHDRFIHASAEIKSTLVSKLSRGLPPFRKLLIGSYEYKG
jgi:cell wall-associated NlpC family hydrolase